MKPVLVDRAPPQPTGFGSKSGGFRLGGTALVVLILALSLVPIAVGQIQQAPVATTWPPAIDGKAMPATLEIHPPIQGDALANASAHSDLLPPGILPDEPRRQPPSIEASARPTGAGQGERVAWTAALLVIVAFGAAQNSGLIGHAVFGLFSRIDRRGLLANPVRLRIHAAILKRPGITLKEIAKLQEIGWGTAVYHLGRLEQGRLVVSQRHRQFRRFYDACGGIRPLERGARAELANPTSQRIAALVVENPGASQRVIADAVGISAAAAHKYLGRLEHARLLTRQRDVKRVRYAPTQDLLDLHRQVL